ncbi:hypothetical protein AB0F81_19350 [Actinoplanes sp. NPDC024001]|uniref:hypothetical protein n=1 Tax=Actinoplanes sp. NPDC024001 TaxID=3154598 RepID=UPI0034060056
MPTLEARVTRLEERMDEVERLRASQDHDLSDLAEKLRVQTTLLKALSETQSEHTATLAQHTAAHAQHAAALAEHTEKLDRLDGGMHKIIGMLDTLIERDNRQ